VQGHLIYQFAPWLSRHLSLEVYESTGVYERTDTNFWTVGFAWQYRWGGSL
jgi:hypothetical protein